MAREYENSPQVKSHSENYRVAGKGKPKFVPKYLIQELYTLGKGKQPVDNFLCYTALTELQRQRMSV